MSVPPIPARVRELAYLVSKGVAFNAADAMDDDTRREYVIAFGEMDGARFDHELGRWEPHLAGASTPPVPRWPVPQEEAEREARAILGRSVGRLVSPEMLSGIGREIEKATGRATEVRYIGCGLVRAIVAAGDGPGFIVTLAPSESTAWQSAEAESRA